MAWRIGFFFLFTLGASLPAFAQFSALEVFDMPSDGGGRIGLRWPVVPGENGAATYQVLVSDQSDGAFVQRAEFAADTHYESELAGPWWVWGSLRPDWHFVQLQSDTQFQLTNGKPYFFQLVFLSPDGRTVSQVLSATPQANLFNWTKLNNLLLMLAFGAVVLFSIHRGARESAAVLTAYPRPGRR